MRCRLAVEPRALDPTGSAESDPAQNDSRAVTTVRVAILAFGSAMTAGRDNSRGILAMNASMFLFIVNDTLVKYLTLSMPLGEVVFFRGTIASVVLAIAVGWSGEWRAWRGLIDRRMGLRAFGELGGTFFYLAALVHMPLANATAVFQVTPLAMTACAAIFLGERVGPRRWVAIAIGFIGVMVIVRPGLAGFDVWSLAVLSAVAFVALRDIATAKISFAVPGTLVTLATALSNMVLGLMLWPFEHLFTAHAVWVMPTSQQVLLLGIGAVGLTGGYAALLHATRLAETSAIAPFRYTLLVWSFLFGVLVFGQYPDLPILIGSSIVVATGLYSYHRERVRRASSSSR